MKTLTFDIVSTRPLLMAAETLANPLNDKTRAYKAVYSKRKKTDDDHLWLLHAQWDACMYHADDIGPFIPAINIEACLAEAAKATKQGKTVKQAINVITDRARLAYDGPRDKVSMYGAGNTPFVDVRGAGTMGKKIMVCRPMFRQWALTFALEYFDDMLNRDDIIRIVEHAGRAIGLGTYRPRFGRFDIAACD